MSHLDADFMLRYAHEEARRRICATLKALSCTLSPPLKLPETFGIFITFMAGRYQGGCCAVLDNNLADDSSLLPFYPLGPRRNIGTESGTGEEQPEFHIILRISYAVGTEERTMQLRTSIDRAACEGRACSCCRFHGPGSTKGCDDLEHWESCRLHTAI